VPLFNARKGQRLHLVGSLPQLGSWKPEEGLVLQPGRDNMWKADVDLPVGVQIKAKVH
jgi:hypothetical protein